MIDPVARKAMEQLASAVAALNGKLEEVLTDVAALQGEQAATIGSIRELGESKAEVIQKLGTLRNEVETLQRYKQDMEKAMSDLKTSMEEETQEIKDVVEDVRAKVEENMGNYRVQDDKKALTHKGMHLPEKFGGNREDFHEWTEEVLEHMSIRHRQANKLMKWAIRQKVPITMEDLAEGEPADLADNPVKIAEDLFIFTRNFSKGEAKKLVRQAEENNGLEAWRLLHEEYAPHTDHSENVMWIQVANPKQVTKLDQLMGSIVDWETLVNRYIDVSGKPVDDRTKKTVLIQFCPETLQEWLMLNSGSLHTYRDYRKKVLEYVNIKRMDSKKVTPAHNVEAAQQEEEQDKGYEEAYQVDRKGGGKGKAGKNSEKGDKGKTFSGACWTCGGPHPQFFCSQYKPQKGKGLGLGKGGPKGWGQYGGAGKGYTPFMNKGNPKGTSKGGTKGAMAVEQNWTTEVFNAAMQSWGQAAAPGQAAGAPWGNQWSEVPANMSFMGLVERKEEVLGKKPVQELSMTKPFGNQSYFQVLQSEEEQDWPLCSSSQEGTVGVSSNGDDDKRQPKNPKRSRKISPTGTRCHCGSFIARSRTTRTTMRR